MTFAPRPPSNPLSPSGIGPTGKAYIASLRSTSATWNQSAVELDADHADLMFFYCVDSSSGCRWLGQATHTSFLDLCAEVRAEPITNDENLADLDKVISASIHERKTFQARVSFSIEELIPTELLLMQALACVAATAETPIDVTYHPGCHFIVVRYTQSGSSLFRSALISKDSIGHNGPLSDDECANLAKFIIDEDKSTHPDWFLPKN